MQKLSFNINISASCETVWNILWSDTTYRQWTSAFGEGSHAISDWQKGSKILFLGAEGQGMVSRIDDLIPNRFMSFQHLGELKDGVEDTTSERVQQWANGRENYTLNSSDGSTELIVDLDMPEEFADFFTEAFPKALTIVKQLAEQK